MAFREIGLEQYPFIAIGVFTILAAGAVPWWDQRRVTQAVANGEAKQDEGPIRDWRVTRGHRKRQSTGVYLSNPSEHFSVGGVDFDLDRKSVVSGKSVPARVDIGCLRIIKKTQ